MHFMLFLQALKNYKATDWIRWVEICLGKIWSQQFAQFIVPNGFQTKKKKQSKNFKFERHWKRFTIGKSGKFWSFILKKDDLAKWKSGNLQKLFSFELKTLKAILVLLSISVPTITKESNIFIFSFNYLLKLDSHLPRNSSNVFLLWKFSR